jgi:hypothetical protein
MIVFPALAYLFSGAGLLVLSAFGMPVVSQSGELNRSVWLAVGLALAFVLFTLAVGRWGAPRELWLVAAVWAVLQVLRLVDVAVFSYTGRELLGGYSETMSVLGTRFFEASAFRSMSLYVVATVGYLLVAVLGCWVGLRWRARSPVDGPDQPQHT